MAYIGIDIGTSGSKALVYNAKGEVLTVASIAYSETRKNGMRELNPITVKNSVLSIIRNVAIECKENIQAICITTLGESFICTDANDVVLCPSMVTGDTRGEQEIQVIEKEFGSDSIFSITGLTPSLLYSLPKLLWLGKHSDLSKNSKIFFFEDYLGYVLTGERKISFSSASRSMAFDINTRKWNVDLLGFADLETSQFSDPVPSGSIIGKINPSVACALHLSDNVVVVAGGHDQALACLGSGLIDCACAEDGIGTCECISMLLPENQNIGSMQKKALPNMIYPYKEKHYTILELTTCGALSNWMRDVIFSDIKNHCIQHEVNFFEYMDTMIINKKNNMLMLPQFGSSGNPDPQYHVTGCISGLTLETDKSDIYLALKESMIYQMKMAVESAKEINLDFSKLIITGGAAKSRCSASFRADIYQKPVYTLKNKEAGSMGCMILASTAFGDYPDIKSCVQSVVKYEEIVEPNPHNFAYHTEKYLRFKDLYDRMHLFR